MNSLIQAKIQHKKQSVENFIELMEDLVRKQESKIVEAIIGIGEWNLAPGYEHILVSQEAWFKLTEEKRMRHLQKFLNAPLQLKSVSKEMLASVEEGLLAPSDSFDQSSHSDDTSGNLIKLPVGARSSGIENVPYSTLKAMWEKAEDLLNRKDAVTHAPGGDAKARMILSSSDICPHFVHTCQPFNGQFMCDCHNYKTFSLCSHSLVTATVNDALDDFLEWHTTTFTGVNVSKIATEGQPRGEGRKGRVAKRKRPTAKSVHGCPKAVNQTHPQKQKTGSQLQRRSESQATAEVVRPFFIKFMNSYVRICQGCRVRI